MANIKVINISDLLPKDPLVLVIDGVEHQMAEMSVDDLIATFDDIESMDKMEKLSDRVTFLKRVIKRGFPTMTEEVTGKWPFQLLQRVFAIVQAGDDVKVEETDAAGK